MASLAVPPVLLLITLLRPAPGSNDGQLGKDQRIGVGVRARLVRDHRPGRLHDLTLVATSAMVRDHVGGQRNRVGYVDRLGGGEKPEARRAQLIIVQRDVVEPVGSGIVRYDRLLIGRDRVAEL